MRDDDLAFVGLVQRDLRDVRWPDAAELRTRARRRSRRMAVLAAAVVLVVASGSAAAVAARPRPAAPPAALTATAEPSPSGWVPAEVPLDVLLGPSDVGTQTESLTEAGLGEKVSIDEQLLWCHRLQRVTADWEPSRYSRSVTLLRQRPPGTEHPPADFLLSQDVYRVAPDVGGRLFDGIDRMLTVCDKWRSTGPAQWQGKLVDAEATHRWQVVARDFAGTESVLVRHTVSQARNRKTGKPFGPLPRPTSTAVVRVGDLVSVINGGRDETETDLRRLATVAAGRMCAAAVPRC